MPANIKGLTTADVRSRLKKYGYNEIIQEKHWTKLRIFLSQFTSALIVILIIAGVVSIALHEYIDGIAILAIVLINAVIGFFQEYKAENAVKALKKMVVPTAIVIRNGEQKELPIREIVPDDIVVLSEGDKVPADLQLVESFSLKIDESMLTGESVPAEKKANSKGKEAQAFKGTIISTGRALGKVTNTGANTEFGKIITLVSRQEKTRSPLTQQLDQLGKKVGLTVLGLIIIIFILGELRGIELVHMFMTSVALGVSAIPEGMPIIVTLTLALGVQILAGKKAIVRKMNSIETLGATTFICSDKTGTLTLNEMTVKKIYTGFEEKEIPGLGYKFKQRIKLITPEEIKLMEICENCNNSSVTKKTTLGDPTEIALKVMNRKAGYKKEYKKIDEKVFTSARKMMSTLHKVGSKKQIMAKGAFEEILKRSTHILEKGKKRKITAADKLKIKKIADAYAKQALRVLGFAYKEMGKNYDEKGLTFVGLVGMIDPPRKTVKKSIAIAQAAGIQVRIITGDNPITARAVGEAIGLNVTQVMTGDQIDKLNDKQLKKALKETQIFARTKPEHKYRLVDILKKQQEVVAVTGDGVNDAPALKHSDVGIAMGIKGTEATKEVADIVLKDDNFSTIVTTIKEGRRIYHNILAFIKYMLSSNFDTIMAVGVLTIMGLPLPILPLQILWINIATDALPALALGVSEAEPGIMKEKPHPKKENIFKKFFIFILTAAIMQTIINIALYLYGAGVDQSLGINTADLDMPSHARTLVMTQLIFFEVLFVFMCKDEKFHGLSTFTSNKKLLASVILTSSLQIFLIYTPFMQEIFRSVPLAPHEWLMIALGSSTAFIVPSISNFIKKVIKT